MKVTQFTVPVAQEDSVVVCEDIIPYFYNYFHRHKEMQITLVVKGSGTLIVGNYTQRFNPGDLYIIGANQPHIFKSDPGYFEAAAAGNAHAIHVFFDHQKLLSNLINIPEMADVKKFLGSTYDGLQVPAVYGAAVAKRVKQINKSSGFKRLLSFLKLLQYLTNDVQNWKSLNTGFPDYTYSDKEGIRMNYIYQYTIAHYAEDITLERIASLVHMTPQAFCKYFKKHTRKTYMTFLNEIRINEACKRIISGNFDGISSIAYAMGFNSAINFNRVFKKTTGHSPSEYRKAYKYRREAHNVMPEALRNSA